MNIIKETKYHTSNLENENLVQGKFAKAKILNAAKSKKGKKKVFDEVTVCIIKINSAVNKDSVVHTIINGDNKSEKLKERFKSAWAEFAAMTKNQNEPAQAQTAQA